MSLGGEIGKNLASGSSRKCQVRSDRHDPATASIGISPKSPTPVPQKRSVLYQPARQKEFIVYADENLTAFSNLTESHGMTVTE